MRQQKQIIDPTVLYRQSASKINSLGFMNFLAKKEFLALFSCF